jgi:antitoxin component YwqK of YwqJK toxin-antitoxin module
MKICIQIINGFMALWKTFYKDILYNMIHTEYYKDGTSCECDSMRRTNYMSGALMLEFPCADGNIHGIERGYRESGSLLWEAPFIKGTKHGIYREYDLTGALRLEIPYIDDVEHGIARHYSESGSVIKEISWVKGAKAGLSKENFL